MFSSDAQESMPSGESFANPGPSSGGVADFGFLSSFETWLSLAILLFGFFVILCEYLLLRNRNATSEAILRIFAVTLIVVGTFFAVAAGYGSEQIAPAMGLFGTIAGYLLGKRHTTEKGDES